MKWNFALIAAAGLALLSATPALAGTMSPAQLDSYCWTQAERVRPMLTAAEKEAFVANCKANASAERK